MSSRKVVSKARLRFRYRRAAAASTAASQSNSSPISKIIPAGRAGSSSGMDGSLPASAAIVAVVNGSRNSSRVASAKYGKKKSETSSSKAENAADMAPVASVGVPTKNSSPVDGKQQAHGVDRGADSQTEGSPQGKEGLRADRPDSSRHEVVVKKGGDHKSTSAKVPSDEVGSRCSATEVSKQSPPGQTAVDPATSTAQPVIEREQGGAADKMKKDADISGSTSQHRDASFHTSENHLLTATGAPQSIGVDLDQHHSALETPEAEYRRTERFGTQLPQTRIVHTAVSPVAIGTTGSKQQASTTTRPASAVLPRSTANAGACSARHPRASNAANVESTTSGVERSTHEATYQVRSDKRSRKQKKPKTNWRRVDRSSSTRNALVQTQSSRASAPPTSNTTLPEAKAAPAGTAPAYCRPETDSNITGTLKHPDNSSSPAASPSPYDSSTPEGLSSDKKEERGNHVLHESTQGVKSEQASSNVCSGATLCSTLQPVAMRQTPATPLLSLEGDANAANVGDKREAIPHHHEQQQQQPAAKVPVRPRPVLRADAQPFEWSKSTAATISSVRANPRGDHTIASATETDGSGGCLSTPPLAAAAQQNTTILPERPAGSKAPTFTTETKLWPPPASVSPPLRVPLADVPTTQAAPLPSSESWCSPASEEVMPCGIAGNVVATNKMNSYEESCPSSTGNADEKGGVSATSNRNGKEHSERSTSHTNERLLELSQRPKRPGSKQRMRNNKKVQQQKQKAQHDQHEDGHPSQQQQQQPQEQQEQQQKQQQRPEGKGTPTNEGATSNSTTSTKRQTPADYHVPTQHAGVTAPHIRQEQPSDPPTSPSPTNSISTDHAPTARSRIAPEKAMIGGTPAAGGSGHGHTGDGPSYNSTENLVYERVQVTEEVLAQWVGDRRGTDGGACGEMLRDVKQSSGARAVDVRVVGKGRNNGNKNKGGSTKRKVYIDICAVAPAHARLAKVLLNTHLKSRLELLRLEEKRRSLQGSLAAFKEEIERGLRVQFFTRREWVGILIGKGGTRINAVQKSTGCTITVDDGDVGGGRSRAWRRGSGDRFNRARGAGWAGDLSSSRSARSARVIISGPDRDRVGEAREMMEFSEAMIAVNSAQATILGRQPRTKLLDLKEQSECPVVDLWFPPVYHGTPTDDTQSAASEPGRHPEPCTEQGVATTAGSSMGGGHGVGQKAMVRVIGPSTSVESARALLFVILRYLDEEKAIQKNDLVVRKKLSAMQASYGRMDSSRSKSGPEGSAVRADRPAIGKETETG